MPQEGPLESSCIPLATQTETLVEKCACASCADVRKEVSEDGRSARYRNGLTQMDHQASET